jgi:hypothetical protein
MCSKLHDPFLSFSGPCQSGLHALRSAIELGNVLKNSRLYVIFEKRRFAEKQQMRPECRVPVPGDQSEFIVLPELRGLRPIPVNPVLLC